MPIQLQTRREFIRNTIVLASAAWSVPTFLNRTVWALEDPRNEAKMPGADDGRILVVIQLGGGNDGLNTIIPHSDPAYYKSRPVLAIPKGKTLKINDEIGLNPQLSALKGLYDQGQMGIIQGVGYPNPNRSHFRSMEIWQTASDANKLEPYGWIGRYFDHHCEGCDPTTAVNIGRLSPQAFVAKSPFGVSIEDPEMYRWIHKEEEGMGAGKSAESFFRKINEKSAGSDAMAGGEAGSLDYLQRTAMNAQLSSDKIREVVKKYKSSVTYPDSSIGYSLKLVAQMIAGKLPTKIYYVSQTGYDTHKNQLAEQTQLLNELSSAVGAFYKDLKQQGNEDRVLSFTFSEFGRRVHENASGGTDHGAAGPLFVFGSRIKPGIFGKQPSLTQLVRGDLKHEVDFRSVYATVIEKWMGGKAADVLGRPFPLLDFV